MKKIINYIIFFAFLSFFVQILLVSKASSKEVIKIYTLEKKILNRPIIDCEALAKYLNSKPSPFLFKCEYVNEKTLLDVKNEIPFKIVILSPPLFIELKEKLNQEKLDGLFPLFNIYSKNLSVGGKQGTVIFTRSDSPIQNLTQLKNKTLGAINFYSSCFIMSLYELKKAGLKEGDIQIKFLNSLERVVEEVLNGKIAAGAVRSGVLEHLSRNKKIDLKKIKVLSPKKYPDFPLLVSTELIPDWYLVYSVKVTPKLLSYLYSSLSIFAEKNIPIPGSDIGLSLPQDPYHLNLILRELLLGPFFKLRKKIKKEKIELAINFIVIISLMLILTLYIFYLFRKNSRLRKELEENQKILKSLLEEKDYSLSYTYKRLEEEMKIMRNIINNLDMGIALLDPQGRVIRANHVLCNYLNNSIEAMLNKDFYELLVNFLNPLEKIKLLKHEDFRNPVTIRINRKKDERFFQFKKIPLDNLTLVILRDITVEKKWEEEVTRYSQLETLRIISSGLAHDLNNLLSAILNNIEILLLPQWSSNSDTRNTKLREKLMNIKNTCLRAKTLTQELLIYGKSLILTPETTSLIDFIKEITEFSIAGSGISVTYSFEPNIDKVKFDKSLLSIALHNIILNARQAMNDRGELYISLEKERDFMIISIRDTGPGIPEEIKKDLFKPFVTTKPGGSGLGLFTAKRILEAHGGKIEVESTTGEGTTVKLYLPSYEEIYIEEEPAKLKLEDLISEKKASRKILLMDDEAEIRESLKELLENFGYEVTTCENGEKALEIYKEQGPFDIVILDLTVPGKYDGVQTLQEIRKIDPTVNAILATGYAYKSEAMDPKEHGFKGILIKPFSIESLLEMLNKITS